MSDSNLDRGPIDRDEIRDKFQELKGGLDHSAEAARTPVLGAGMVALVILAALAVWLGRRRGRASRTVVEVRRV